MTKLDEPWLRGTLMDVPVVERALLHSLQMAEEDTVRWCGGLSKEELHLRPFQLPSVAFQLRHIARSLDRFCTYAEGKALTSEQLAALADEMTASGDRESAFAELKESLQRTRLRLQTLGQRPLDTAIGIGRKGLPTTLGGLLVHAAEHTQRHVGQAVTTAKVVTGLRCDPSSPA
jgi:uncharacterized damage-inducible protein DinB